MTVEHSELGPTGDRESLDPRQECLRARDVNEHHPKCTSVEAGITWSTFLAMNNRPRFGSGRCARTE